MPLFLKALPQITGKTFRSMVACRMPAFNSSTVGVSPSRNFSSSTSSVSAMTSINCSAERFGLLQQIGGNRLDRKFGAQGLVVPQDRLHLDQVHYALEVRLGADGNLQRHGSRAQPLANGLEHVLKVRAILIHFVDEADPRNLVLIALPPNGFRLRLHAETESNNATAPSSTRRLRSTSAVKSTWPGVSIILMRTSRQVQVVAAEVIVMPRSCSCSM
jgi:hypothetical protein